MSNLAVVQRVLDFWDPNSVSYYTSYGPYNIDEYDSYSFDVLELLERNSSQAVLLKYLNDTRLTADRVDADEQEPRNRFFAWALEQTWLHQKLEGSNIRITDSDSLENNDGERRVLSRLELLQQYLQDWDPFKHSKHWLYGADSLRKYDPASLILDKAVDSADLSEIAVALARVSTSDAMKIGFCLDHHPIKGEALEEKFQAYLIERSKHYELPASYLLDTLSSGKRVTRRIRPLGRWSPH